MARFPCGNPNNLKKWSLVRQEFMDRFGLHLGSKSGAVKGQQEEKDGPDCGQRMVQYLGAHGGQILARSTLLAFCLAQYLAHKRSMKT